VGGRGEDAAVGALVYRIVHVFRERDRDAVERAVANHGVAAVLDIHTRGREYVCEMRKDAQGPSRAMCLEGKPALRTFILNYMEMRMAEGLECIADRNLLTEIMDVRCDASPPSPGDPTGSDQGLGGSTKAWSVRVAPLRDTRQDLGRGSAARSTGSSATWDVRSESPPRSGSGAGSIREARASPSTSCGGRSRSTKNNVTRPRGASQRQRGDEGARGRRKCTSPDRKATLETAGSFGELKLQRCSDEEAMKMVRVCFTMPINEACTALDCCSSFLKKICRRNGVARWPYRKLMSIARVMARVRHSMERNQNCGDGDAKSLVGVQLALEMNFLERERCAILGLDPGEDQAHHSSSHND